MLSSKHSANTISNQSREDITEMYLHSTCILGILHTLHILQPIGLDKLDQHTSYYSFCVKWWQKVFFWLLEVAVVNSHIIYKEKYIH